ncbi:peptide deformylase [Aeromonas salmonicida]|uniref:peptide deformylase n=1 Tax=Aeromonas salmonicida TaxID=645 RepID=UPI0024A93893|nr:peptide deformylase [Aeromonas salmonicida]MDM5134990.1 peptide deformylase [Aeromonas salmonicida]WHF41836.1 peptide deformylase [Aeromonas salmonicida]
MSILTILTIPDPRLNLPATPVTDIAAVQDLISDMLETLYATSNGIGLAASQVGRQEAVVVIDISEERNNPLILINPEVISGEQKIMGEEGCLSVPDYYADVERFTKVTVKAQDRHGQPLLLEQDGFLAIVLQHEIDHLKGNLFINYLSPLKRQMALKKVKKSLTRNR